MKWTDWFRITFLGYKRSEVTFTGTALTLFKDAIVVYLSQRIKHALIADDDKIVLRGADHEPICVIKFDDPEKMDELLAMLKERRDARN
jgi:hypothetical protein